MSHVISQVADAVVSSIKNGVSQIDQRVFRSRLYQIQSHELPCVIVSFDAESVSRNEGGPVRPRLTTRTSNWSVIGVSKLNNVENVEDELFDLAAAIETALQSVPGNQIHDLTVNGIDLELSDEGDTPVGYIRLSVQCVVRTRDGDPTQTL